MIHEIFNRKIMKNTKLIKRNRSRIGLLIFILSNLLIGSCGKQCQDGFFEVITKEKVENYCSNGQGGFYLASESPSNIETRWDISTRTINGVAAYYTNRDGSGTQMHILDEESIHRQKVLRDPITGIYYYIEFGEYSPVVTEIIVGTTISGERTSEIITSQNNLVNASSLKVLDSRFYYSVEAYNNVELYQFEKNSSSSSKTFSSNTNSFVFRQILVFENEIHAVFSDNNGIGFVNIETQVLKWYFPMNANGLDETNITSREVLIQKDNEITVLDLGTGDLLYIKNHSNHTKGFEIESGLMYYSNGRTYHVFDVSTGNLILNEGSDALTIKNNTITSIRINKSITRFDLEGNELEKISIEEASCLDGYSDWSLSKEGLLIGNKEVECDLEEVILLKLLI